MTLQLPILYRQTEPTGFLCLKLKQFLSKRPIKIAPLGAKSHQKQTL